MIENSWDFYIYLAVSETLLAKLKLIYNQSRMDHSADVYSQTSEKMEVVA